MSREGRRPDELRPVSIETTSSSRPPAPRSSPSGPPASFAPRASRKASPLARGNGTRMDDGRIRDASRLDRLAHAARGERGQAEGAHRRDPAAPRPLAPGRLRPRNARRAHDLDRLRRDPGGRRNAHGGDQRRLGCAHARRAARGPARARRARRRRLRRHRGRRAASRPRLRRGFRGRRGHERRHDRGRPADRGTGHGGASRSPAPSSTRSSTSRHRDREIGKKQKEAVA